MRGPGQHCLDPVYRSTQRGKHRQLLFSRISDLLRIRKTKGPRVNREPFACAEGTTTKESLCQSWSDFESPLTSTLSQAVLLSSVSGATVASADGRPSASSSKNPLTKERGKRPVSSCKNSRISAIRISTKTAYFLSGEQGIPMSAVHRPLSRRRRSRHDGLRNRDRPREQRKSHPTLSAPPSSFF